MPRIYRNLSVLFLFLVGIPALFVYFGAFDVSASRPHAKLIGGLLAAIMERSVEREARKIKVPDLGDTALWKEGREHFREMCVTCHGAPGVQPSEIGRGLNPEAPDLKEEAGEWSHAELFWITKHGIKMTGMPAFGKTHTDQEIWRIVAFVEKLQGLDSAGYAALAQTHSPGHDEVRPVPHGDHPH